MVVDVFGGTFSTAMACLELPDTGGSHFVKNSKIRIKKSFISSFDQKCEVKHFQSVKFRLFNRIFLYIVVCIISGIELVLCDTLLASNFFEIKLQ